MNATTSALLMLAITLGACTEQLQIKRRFALRFRAQTTSGATVADVRVWADGDELGVTNDEGELQVSLTGHPGQAVSLSVACPPAYRTVDARRRLILRDVHATTERKPRADSTGIQLTAECEPLERMAVIVVRTRGPGTAGLPINVGGELVGLTQPDGTAHLLVRTPPHRSVRVEVDTSQHPELLPSNPVQTFQVDDDDSILLFEQALVVAPIARGAHRSPSRTRRGRVPYRID
jgi:hypothetical protein